MSLEGSIKLALKRVTVLSQSCVTRIIGQLSLLQFSSVAESGLFAIPWTAAHQASLSITNSWSWLKCMSIESVIPFNHLILCRPLLLSSVFPSIRVPSNESSIYIRWPKYWSFSFSVCHSNEYSEMISFRIDWLDLLAVQETLESSPTSRNSSVLSFLYSPTLLTTKQNLHWEQKS